MANIEKVCEFLDKTRTYYLATADAKHFQPMKANFGILPPLDNRPRSKRERYQLYAQRALDKAAVIFGKDL